MGIVGMIYGANFALIPPSCKKDYAGDIIFKEKFTFESLKEEQKDLFICKKGAKYEI